MICLAASQRWISAHGRGCPTPVGRSHYEVNPDLPERWKEIHQRGLTGESQACDEDLWIQADGTRQWLRWSMEPWRDATGRHRRHRPPAGGYFGAQTGRGGDPGGEGLLRGDARQPPGIFYLFDQTRSVSALEPRPRGRLGVLGDGDRRHVAHSISSPERTVARIEETIRKVFETGAADVEAALISKSGRGFRTTSSVRESAGTARPAASAPGSTSRPGSSSRRSSGSRRRWRRSAGWPAAWRTTSTTS